MKSTGNQVYFTLKDELASIPCVTYIPAIMRDVTDGTKVTLRGTVSYWNKAGKISFVVNKCEKFGLSPLYLMFMQLQEKLKSEGLFTAKKAIPQDIKRIGLVTSKTGAVIHDIKTVTWRRNSAVDIVLVDVHVQGVGAEREIAQAIEIFNQNPVDIIIVARGGGSVEDLAPFNTELVARTVFASKIPVVSAVGHESDITLIDFVSDLRAPTPSAAAELVIREVATMRDRVISLWGSMRQIVLHKLERAADNIGWEKLKTTATMRFGELESKCALIAERIEANNPMAILKKGFTKTDIDPSQLKTGDEFEIMYYDNKDISKGVATWKHKLAQSKS